jgi:ATP-dependent protease ClpP protease subunit
MTNADDDSNSLIQGIQKSLYINTIPQTSNTHEVYIDDYIEEPHKYRQLISLLMNAPENDQINIYINSGGGNLDSCAAIINGIQCANANVTGILMGACHSAASIMTMYCHTVHVFDSAYMMVHTASFGSSGNTTTIKAHTSFTIKQVEKLLEDAYEGFLDKNELVQVKNGIEIWLDAEEIKKRLKKRYKLLETKAKRNQISPKEELVDVVPPEAEQAAKETPAIEIESVPVVKKTRKVKNETATK